MPSVAELPSLFEDADFLAELDKLESGPTELEAHGAPAFWDLASRCDEPGDGRLSAATPALPAPALDPPVRRARSAKPARSLRLERPLRPFASPLVPRPSSLDDARDAPQSIEGSKGERLAHDRPVHIDEIGESSLTRETAVRAVSVPQPRRVPAPLAALVVAFCLGVGAGAAGGVFHDRVAHLVATWTK